MKYRKKPVLVDARRWYQSGDHPAVVTPVPDDVEISPMALRAETADQFRRNHGAIHTLEGWMLVTPGDYIIRGVQGEHYPCKPDIFNATYEAVE